MESNAVFKESFQERKKHKYREFLHSLSSVSSFHEDTWTCDKVRRNPSEKAQAYSIYFINTPAQYKEIVKYFLIVKLIAGFSIPSARQNVIWLNRLLKYAALQNIDDLIGCCSHAFAVGFKQYLDENSKNEHVNHSIWQVIRDFFNVMNGWDGKSISGAFHVNPYFQPFKKDDKLIPEYIEKQLDHAFIRPEILPHIAVAYWLMRFFPSRVSEICATPIDCMKPYGDNRWVLFLPTWKQNGGYRAPEIRSIHLKYTDMGKYLIDLIKGQQEVSKALQQHLPESQRGLLLTYKKAWYRYGKWINTAIKKHNVLIATPTHLNVFFEIYCNIYDVRDEQNARYVLKSHQLRHNGITDRLASGFTLEQIMHMTGHHSESMILNSYNHLDQKPDIIAEKQRAVLGITNQDAPLMFKGRILNMNAETEARLLRNIRTHRVRGGICADITGCKGDMVACLDCEHFVPEVEQLGYYEEQIKLWNEKAERFKAFPIVVKNASVNVRLYEMIAEKIRTLLEDGQSENNS